MILLTDGICESIEAFQDSYYTTGTSFVEDFDRSCSSRAQQFFVCAGQSGGENIAVGGTCRCSL